MNLFYLHNYSPIEFNFLLFSKDEIELIEIKRYLTKTYQSILYIYVSVVLRINNI